MKKILLVLLGVLIFAAPAYAQILPGQLRKASEVVLWRTNAAAYAAPGHRDTAYVSGTGAITDTSVAFIIDEWFPPRVSTGFTDTAAVFTFDFFPINGSSPTAVEGAATIVFQVSVDGNNWLPAGSVTANELGTSNTFSHPFKSLFRPQGTDPLVAAWRGAPLGRILWTHHSTYVGQFAGRVRGYKLRN